jgi:hypothetical protein
MGLRLAGRRIGVVPQSLYHGKLKMYHHGMVKWRAVLSFVLVLMWTAAPALACIPKSTMTQVEMECCKKMAGNCHTNSRNHPCCEKNVDQASVVATVQQAHAVYPVFTAVILDGPSVQPRAELEFRYVKFDSPPHSPPSANSPLRI